MSDTEKNYLSTFQKKAKKKHFKKVSKVAFFLPDAGSWLYHEKEYMIIVSDGDIDPPGIKVARRQVNGDLKKQALNNYKDLLNATPLVQGMSESLALDLKIVADKISRSEFKRLTSLQIDFKGEERSKDHYLEAIEEFLKNCHYPGGKMHNVL